jgi:hypothetical protein
MTTNGQGSGRRALGSPRTPFALSPCQLACTDHRHERDLLRRDFLRLCTIFRRVMSHAC